MARSTIVRLDGAALEAGSKTANTAIFILIAKAATLVFAGIGIVLIARILGPTAYGIYVFATSAAGLLSMFGDFGIGTAAIKFVSEHMSKNNVKTSSEIITTGFILVFLLCGAITLIAFLLATPLAAYFLHDPTDAYVIQWASFVIVLGAVWGTSISTLVGLGRGKEYALLAMLQSGTQACIGVLMALMGYGPVAPIIGVLAGFLLGTLVALRIISRQLKIDLNSILFSTARAVKVLRFSLPIAISGSVRTIPDNFAPILLAFYSTAQVLGNVGIAIKVLGILDLIVGSIGMSLLPLFSKEIARKTAKGRISEYYNYSIYTSILLATPVSFYLVVLAKQFSFVTFGGTYGSAPIYIALASIGALISIIWLYAYSLLVAAGSTRQILKYNTIASLIILALLFALVPTLNGLGLAFAIFIAEPLVTDVLYMAWAFRSFKIRPELSRISRIVASGVISAGFILPLRYFIGGNFLLVLFAAFIEQLLVYPPLIAYTGAIEKEDIDVLEGITARIPVVNVIFGTMLGYTRNFV